MTEYRLSETPWDTWANTILYRLAEALGHVPNHPDGYAMDPDELLREAVETIKNNVIQ